MCGKSSLSVAPRLLTYACVFVCTLIDARLKGLFWTLGQCWSFVVCLSVAHAFYTPSQKPSILPSSHPPTTATGSFIYLLLEEEWRMCGVYISICVSSSVCLCACACPPTVFALWHKYKHFISSNLNFDLACCCHSLCDGPIMFTLAV